MVLLPGKSFCFLSTMHVAYYTSRLISDLFISYFRTYCCFSLVSPFLTTRLVWFCLNLVISAFQFELVPSFPLKMYESFTKFTLHLLLVLLPGNSFCLLSTMLVSYCTSRFLYSLFLTYFRPHYCFAFVSRF